MDGGKKKREKNINVFHEIYEKLKYRNSMIHFAEALCLAVLFWFLLNHISFIYGILIKIWDTLRPFVYGFVMAYVLRPTQKFIEKGFLKIKTKKPHPKAARYAATTIAVIFGIVVVVAVVIAIVPSTVQSLINLIQTFPSTFTTWYENARQLVADRPQILAVLTAVYDKMSSSLSGVLQDNILPNLQTYMSSVGSGAYATVSVLKDILIGVFVMIYLLAGREKFKGLLNSALKLLFKENTVRIIKEELHFADNSFNGFINGKILDSAIIGVITYVFCLITRMPSAVLVAVVIGVTNIIPFFGPLIGAIPCLLLIFVTSPMKSLWFLIFIIILQQLDGNFIGPKILGNTTGVSSFWVLFSIVLFGGLFGVPGMIIGVPLFAVIRDILKKAVRHHYAKIAEQERQDEAGTETLDIKVTAEEINPKE